MLLKAVLIALAAGIADILPMVMRKLPRYSTVSAFIHYFFVSILIIYIDLPFLPWWIEGGVIGLALIIPMLIHVGHSDRKPIPVIAANAFVLGLAVGVAAHYMI